MKNLQGQLDLVPGVGKDNTGRGIPNIFFKAFFLKLPLKKSDVKIIFSLVINVSED